MSNNETTRNRGTVFTVMSGKGGVGKSTVAVNLASHLASKGYKTGIMDVDLHGPSVPRMLGIQDEFLTGQDGKILPHKVNENLKAISIGLMMENRDEAVIWRGPLMHNAIKEFIQDVDWGDLDYLIVDSPPGTGDVHLSLSQFLPEGNSAVMVTTPQDVSIADVKKSINFCKAAKIPVFGIIENMSGFKCPHCSQIVDIFSNGGGEALAKEMDILFLGKIPMDPSICEKGDKGNPLAESEDSTVNQIFLEIITKLTDKEN